MKTISYANLSDEQRAEIRSHYRAALQLGADVGRRSQRGGAVGRGGRPEADRGAFWQSAWPGMVAEVVW